jgi:excisionase family DNA binding protein
MTVPQVMESDPRYAGAAEGYTQPLLLTVTEAAGLLGLSPCRLYALIAERQLPPGVVIRFGRAVRVSRVPFLRWLHGESRGAVGEGF